MTLDAAIILVGALIGLLPFLGFPNSWDTVMFFILGIVLIALGVAVRRDVHIARAERRRKQRAMFVENEPIKTGEYETV